MSDSVTVWGASNWIKIKWVLRLSQYGFRSVWDVTLGRWVSGSRRFDETHCLYLRGSGSPRRLLTHHTVKWDITDPTDTVSSWHANSRSVSLQNSPPYTEPEVLWRHVTRTRHWSLSAASISAPHTHTHTHTHITCRNWHQGTRAYLRSW